MSRLTRLYRASATEGGEGTVDDLTRGAELEESDREVDLDQDSDLDLDPAEIGPYRVLGQLARGGGGGGGAVYLGRSADGGLVAVRVLVSGLAADPDLRERLRGELADSRDTARSFTVPVIDADLDADLAWLAAEYLDAPSLAHLVEEDGPLPQDAALALARGLAEALADLHGGGLAYGGLTPRSILMTSSGPRLIDLELSRARRSADNGPTEAEDIHALGAVLRFAAPATGSDSLIGEIAASCLAEEAADRPTAGDLLQRLEAAIGEIGSTAPTLAAIAVGPVIAVALGERQPAPGAAAGVGAGAVGIPGTETPTVVVALSGVAAGNQGNFGAPTVSAPYGRAMPLGAQFYSGPGFPPAASGYPTSNPVLNADKRRSVAFMIWIATSALTVFAALTALTLFAASDGAWPDTRPVSLPTSLPTVQPTNEPTNPAPPPTPTEQPPTPTSVTIPSTPTVAATTPAAVDYSDAYFASVGDCVYGSSGDSAWSIESCQSGNFTVKARFAGTTDTSSCTPLAGGWSEYWTETDSSADVLLCLQFNYPSPVGYATSGDCYYMTGSGGSMQFATVSSCSNANVQVTGYTDSYSDSSYCSGSNGWFSYEPPDFTSLAYTVCFDDI